MDIQPGYTILRKQQSRLADKQARLFNGWLHEGLDSYIRIANDTKTVNFRSVGLMKKHSNFTVIIFRYAVSVR